MNMAERLTSRERRKNTHRLPFFENPPRAGHTVAGRLLAVNEDHLGKAFGNLKSFKEVIEADTKGAVEVQIFPNSQLGNDRQMAQMVKLGTLDASGIGFSSTAVFAPEIELFNFPFMFRDTEHFFTVVNGPIGERMARIVEGADQHQH